MSDHFEIAIIGSGFAGSLLARLLARSGRSVVLIESARHPRFALGESSTPLAAIALERMARRFGLPELAQFASYGRWQAHQPELRCGLKRGFSFYGHCRGETFSDPQHRRMLVAASPSDALADSHWLRADVDARFARRAVEDGAALLEGHQLVAVEQCEQDLRLMLRTDQGGCEIRAGFAVDASGGALASALAIGSTPTCEHQTTLVYGHFHQLADFADQLPAAFRDSAPYPEGQAANHHLFDGGWFYLLPFDDGRVSAGVLIEREWKNSDPESSWQQALALTPSLARCFRRATVASDVPLGLRRFTRSRRVAAVGKRWALLPHSYAFQDPMFSTGIAWSLIAVERLTEVLAADPSKDPGRRQTELARYAQLLQVEADQVSALCRGARALYGDFERFVDWARLYFIAASYCEARQRFCDPPGACWEGFLGATDSVLSELFAQAEPWFALPSANIREQLKSRLLVRDVGGFLASGLTTGVDLGALIAAAHKLGLSENQLRERIPAMMRGEWS
ncbi:MAG: tryptophan 7-halogenase [Xanthomonadales bacterium]|nr:tryptophan 7-halogenase [Xanthomonadales bacterium]